MLIWYIYVLQSDDLCGTAGVNAAWGGKRSLGGRWACPLSWLFTVAVQLLGHARLFETHGLQHTRLPCPSPSPEVCSNSCPLSQWCHPAVSSSVIPFSSHLQSFPASGSFLMSQLFMSGGQSIGASASASVLSMNIQGCDNFTGCTHLSELKKFYTLLYLCFIAECQLYLSETMKIYYGWPLAWKVKLVEIFLPY